MNEPKFALNFDRMMPSGGFTLCDAPASGYLAKIRGSTLTDLSRSLRTTAESAL
jgi:hypothetical protein